MKTFSLHKIVISLLKHFQIFLMVQFLYPEESVASKQDQITNIHYQILLGHISSNKVHCLIYCKKRKKERKNLILSLFLFRTKVLHDSASIAFFILLRASIRIALFFYARSFFLTCIIKNPNVIINTSCLLFFTVSLIVSKFIHNE